MRTDANRQYEHECANCGAGKFCSAADWAKHEGAGCLWFCSQACEESWRGDGDDLPPSPDTINEDDWRVDR